MPYGEKLKLIKKNKGLTNSAIHKICDVPLSTVTRVFDEETPSANFETFAKLAAGLGFSLDELAGLKPSREIDAELIKEKDATIDSYIAMVKEKDETIRSYADMIKEKDVTVNSYIELLKTKDDRIQELKEEKVHERAERRRLTCALVGFVALVLIILAIDVLNGQFGYFQR